MSLDRRCKSIQFLFVFLTTATAYLTGSLKKENGQTTLLLRDLFTCIRGSRHFFISHYVAGVYDCIRTNLHNCVVKKPVPISESIISGAPLFPQTSVIHCGSIWVKENPPDAFEKQVVVQVMKGHHIHFGILLFKFSLLRLSSRLRVHCVRHSMIIGTETETEMYCGSRIPWTILVTESKAAVRLIITKYIPYSLKIFYSGFHQNWVENVAQVMTRDYQKNNSIEISQSLNIRGIYGKWHEFYMVVNPPDIIMLQVVWLEKSNTSMQIHDGPGPVSKLIYRQNEQTSHAHGAMKSTSFSAFARIASTYRYDISVRIHMSISDNVWLYDVCGPRLRRLGSITAKSRRDKNTACSYSFSNLVSKHYIISLKSFTYNGPDMINSLSSNVCQYGALVIYFTTVQEVVYCENISGLKLYSTTDTFTIVIAWFSGYSRGELILTSSLMDCNVLYGELLSPEKRNNSDVTLRIGQEDRLCSILICPPALSERKTRCVVKLGPPSLGTTKIRVSRGHTMTACEPLFPSIKSFKNTAVHMDTIFQPKWPLGFPDNLTTRVKINGELTNTYKYLHKVTIYLNHMCDIAISRVQMMVIVEISHCFRIEQGSVSRLVINNVPRLSQQCIYKIYSFFAVAEDSTGNGRNHDFIYRDAGYLSLGHEVRVKYDKCPVECRHYNYSVFMRGENESIVAQYTANVGKYIYTSDKHRGFRVSMLIPKKKCNCKLSIVIANIPAWVSRDLNFTEDKLRTLQLYSKRYSNYVVPLSVRCTG